MDLLICHMRKTLFSFILLFLTLNLLGNNLLQVGNAESDGFGVDNGETKPESYTGIPEGVENQAVKRMKTRYWAASSVLATGNWVKIKTSGRGICKISYATLKSWGFSDPENVCLFGNGGYMLSKMNDDPFEDDLVQNSVWHGKDSKNADCLFFYSTGTIEWTYNSAVGVFKHQSNDYADQAVYFLSEQGSRKLVMTLPEASSAYTDDINTFLDYQLYEDDSENLIQSGRQWFGDSFQAGESQQFSFTVDNLDLDSPYNVYISAAGRGSGSSSFSIYYNGSFESSINFSAVETSSSLTQYANTGESRFELDNPASEVDLTLKFNSSSSSAYGWLDYIELNTYRNLVMDGSSMNFRFPGSVGPGKVSRFNLSGVSSGLQIWDVTDYLNPEVISYSQSGSLVSFNVNTDSLREFVAFYPTGSVPEATKVEVVANQNLHQMSVPDMIIISHPDFWDSAEELANFHVEHDQMDVAVVDPNAIYNEFSSGIPDVAGIRNFLRYCYEKSTSGLGTLKYVLLFGDGSYDNKDILGKGLNFIPTYQSENSLLPTASFVSDDFFVLLDPGEGEYNGLIDLGIGRIPAETEAEAEIAVSKIENYVSSSALGEWRNMICFIADDEDSNTHISHAESLSGIVDSDMAAMAVSKIYFDAYQEESTPSGDQYPDVTSAINNRVKDGALVLNYTGHANELALAGEKVLTINDIDAWTNYNKLPVFVTATCEFSRFDGDEKSGGEHILFNGNGGGVALFSTTRVVYSTPNFLLNSEFYNQLFTRDENGDYQRMGDVMKQTKNAISAGINKRNFMLLGDPALSLAIPKYNVVTRTINGVDPALLTEPIGALSKVVVTGELVDNEGMPLIDFNGELTPVVYDKEETVETLGNNDQTPFEYKTRNNIIYKGLSSVTNGEFEFSFIVPKDISYAVGNGKILYYASDSTIDAHGANSEFQIGGSSGDEIVDTQGPEIALYLNTSSFHPGDEVGVNSIMYLQLSDESGINTVSAGIGHDITAILDGDDSDVIVLNDYYLSDLDSYTSGTVVYPLSGLSVGEHTLTVKVWDILNNSTEVTIHFIVTGGFKIEDVICYPNPLTEYTRFKILQNSPDEIFDARIEIFDTRGSLIDVLTEELSSDGTETTPVLWQISDRQVLVRSGSYFYRVILTKSDGTSADKSGTLIILRR